MHPLVLAQPAAREAENLSNQESSDLRALIQASRAKLLHSTNKRGSRRKIRYDDSGNPSAVGGGGEQHLARGDDDGDLESGVKYVQVFLDVSKNFAPVHGKAYVSLKVSHISSRMTMDVRSLYVSPSDLRMPEDILPIRTGEDEGDDDDEERAVAGGTVVTHLVLK